jgi:hypothetical protein
MEPNPMTSNEWVMVNVRPETRDVLRRIVAHSERLDTYDDLLVSLTAADIGRGE